MIVTINKEKPTEESEEDSPDDRVSHILYDVINNL